MEKKHSVKKIGLQAIDEDVGAGEARTARSLSTSTITAGKPTASQACRPPPSQLANPQHRKPVDLHHHSWQTHSIASLSTPSVIPNLSTAKCSGTEMLPIGFHSPFIYDFLVLDLLLTVLFFPFLFFILFVISCFVCYCCCHCCCCFFIIILFVY